MLHNYPEAHKHTSIGNRSYNLDLNKLEQMRIGQKLHKITHNSMKNRESNPRNIHTKSEANPCSGLREVKTVFTKIVY